MIDLNLLWLLLIAHVIADFFLQTNRFVRERKEKKIRSFSLYFHSFFAGALSWLTFVVYGICDAWTVPLVIFVSHLLIDIGKTYCSKDGAGLLLLDQLIHISIIVICWLTYTGQWGIFENLSSDFLCKENTILITLAYLLVTKPVAVAVGAVVRRWENAIKPSREESAEGLEKAGAWIGYLERILILTFILMSYFEGIGFLFAAKSIFRFGELTKSKERALTEYILIGTLLSFTLAIGIGVLLHIIIR